MLGGAAILAVATAYVVWLGFFAGYNRFNLSHMMWNSLMAIFDPVTWLLPLSHSTMTALYFTIVQPSGSFALPGGVYGAQFQVLAAACVLLVILSIWLSVRLYRIGARAMMVNPADQVPLL